MEGNEPNMYDVLKGGCRKSDKRFDDWKGMIESALINSLDEDFYRAFGRLKSRDVRKVMANSSERLTKVIIEEIANFQSAKANKKPSKRSKSADKKGAEKSAAEMPVAAEGPSADEFPGSLVGEGEALASDGFQVPVAPYAVEETESPEMLL